MGDNVLREKQCYRDKITEMVNEIENPWILEQILEFIKNMTKED